MASHRIKSLVIYGKFAKENPALNVITSGQYSRRNHLFPALAQNTESQNAERSNSHASSMLLKVRKPRPVQLLRRTYGASYNEYLYRDDGDLQKVVAGCLVVIVF